MEENTSKKSGLRRLARVVSLNILYLIDNCNLTIDNAINIVFNEYEKYPVSFKNFSAMLITGTVQNKKLIDNLIEKYVKNWTIDRMAIIDKNILRIATFEFLVFLETPINVIINEAIEIAKEYSTNDSGRFVNGLLDQIKNVRKDSELLKQFINKENLDMLPLLENQLNNNTNDTPHK